ncbi:MAG: transglutaminase domain-containing protein [Bacteroidia bacterium]
MNRILYILFIFFLSACVKAQTRDFTQVDLYARTLPQKYTHKIDTLTNHLTSKFNNPIDRVRSIMVWIANNISYDTYNYDRDNVSEENLKIDYILFYKRTICEGYANLFKKMCDISGVTCIKIAGFAKDSLLNGVPLEKMAHSWNIIKIDTDFFIIDPTWGSGYVDQNNHYQKKFEEKYFLADPFTISKSHYPDNSVFQLLENPLSFEEFIGDTVTGLQKENLLNYKDSINSILILPPNEFELATILYKNTTYKADMNRIGYLYYIIAEEKCLKAKTSEEKIAALKNMDDTINYIKANNITGMNEYIKNSDYYKTLLQSK